MPEYKLAFLGFGNVGKALAKLLISKQTELKEHYDISFRTTGIATGRHGYVIDPHGISLQSVLADRLPSAIHGNPPADSFEFIRNCGADVLFENTPVNYESGQPAVDHLRLALSLGMHAITANKGPVVHAYRELTELARLQGKRFYFESSVMDGAPIFSLFRETLPATQIVSLHGVLNSTTNMILTRLEQGESFEQAVAYCQQIGIAETDPSGDVDGWDAAVKVAALVTVLMGVPLQPQQVQRQGIRQISPAEIESARQQGKRWKLLCSARRDGDLVQAIVAPEMVGIDSPMYGVNGTTSILQIESDVLGRLSVIEENPGPHTTAYGLFADFLNAVRD